MDSVATIDPNRIVFQGPNYPSIWKDNALNIMTAAAAAFGILVSLTYGSAIFVVLSVVEIGMVWRIRDVYRQNLGKAEYEYSQTLDNDQFIAWLKKAAEHRYPSAMKDYALRTGNMDMLRDAAHMGNSTALVLVAGANMIQEKLPVIEKKLQAVFILNPQHYCEVDKAKKVIDIFVDTFHIDPFQLDFLKKPLEEMLNRFKFSPEVHQKVVKAIKAKLWSHKLKDFA